MSKHPLHHGIPLLKIINMGHHIILLYKTTSFGTFALIHVILFRFWDECYKDKNKIHTYHGVYTYHVIYNITYVNVWTTVCGNAAYKSRAYSVYIHKRNILVWTLTIIIIVQYTRGNNSQEHFWRKLEKNSLKKFFFHFLNKFMSITPCRYYLSGNELRAQDLSKNSK